MSTLLLYDYDYDDDDDDDDDYNDYIYDYKKYANLRNKYTTYIQTAKSNA
jgi:hypothetical protein